MRRFLILCGILALFAGPLHAGDIVGVSVIPHRIEETLRYRRPREPALAARVQLFVKGPATATRFDGKTPAELLASREWAWHDLATAVKAPAEGLSVWSFNGRSSRWGTGQSFEVEGEGLKKTKVEIAAPRQWISAVTFLSQDDSVQPDTVVLHVVNPSDRNLQLKSLRLWLPKSNATWQTLYANDPISLNTTIPAKDKGFVKLRVKRLPLTYTALQLETDGPSLWAHLRIKREVFDISGGWMGDHLTREPYLRLLCSLHVNTGHFDHVTGYTDQPRLYDRYPLRLFNRLWPLDRWDTDTWLPRIHAVEFLGEPQYGGGNPVPPQEVFDKLLPYRSSRLPTSVTHSEERIWRWYAGLSDYPHYDAYRVVAPAADSWREYDRWGGRRIRWGAPLETIGDLCRSLRDLNRPMPCGYWSQGPHHGWRGGFDGRKRRSPTPEELRAQALHALSTRITSLYWFNLSLKSLVQYPDTWESIRRVGREIKLLAPYYLEGDAYRFERLLDSKRLPDWDLASIASPEAAVLFALDTAYEAASPENVFRFKVPRSVQFRYSLPSWLRRPTEVFRVDADGIHEVKWKVQEEGIVIEDRRSQDAIYVATKSPSVRTAIDKRRQAALAHEKAHAVDQATIEALAR